MNKLNGKTQHLSCLIFQRTDNNYKCVCLFIKLLKKKNLILHNIFKKMKICLTYKEKNNEPK